MFGRPVDSGCLETCEEVLKDFRLCYEYCLERGEFRFPESVIEVAEELGVHPVCLLCRKGCKKSYSFWSFQLPPEEYCGEFEER